ncbi:LysM peptidoglycan-binding domain-containing protein [Peribacillus kribbensis]|uniref:LysM peptidoglycan-binding domain-containing protein n=1 Tax=Peribacillus kribbensis TaxID=356658 RepID=UPI00041D62CA|nr:LysM peptidoglycan-binding domain-containing protein [Peribacillus kribbensis]
MLIHVVKPGESLWSISQSYRVSVSEIIALNELQQPDRLVNGMSLIIPSLSQTHIVLRGDTIWKVADLYGADAQSIVQANRLTDPGRLVPGTSLLVPPKTHIVAAGETLSQIAVRNGVPLTELIRINQIQNEQVPAGTRLFIPLRKRFIEVNAYTTNQGKTGAKEVSDSGRYLTYWTPFAYTIQADGGLDPIKDEPILEAARVQKVAPILGITNFSSTDPGSRLAHTILSSRDLQERLLDNIISVMQAKGYAGLNVDFENVRPADRELYNQFLRRAAAVLHPRGYSLSTAVAPKTSAGQQGPLVEAHDYPAHGDICDFVVLMTYEWGYRLGPPQAISPLNQIRNVLDYAVSVIPRNKIFFGFQIYARDWLIPHRQGQEAETFSQQEAIRRAVLHGAAIEYDPVSQSPFFRYTDSKGQRHEVWFEDARSAQAKFETALEYGVRGISYWVLGYPFPQNWHLLADRFTIRKIR